MQFYSLANQSHFRKNGFALRLALKTEAQGNSEMACLVRPGGKYCFIRQTKNFGSSNRGHVPYEENFPEFRFKKSNGRESFRKLVSEILVNLSRSPGSNHLYSVYILWMFSFLRKFGNFGHFLFHAAFLPLLYACVSQGLGTTEFTTLIS